jgi:hypothetical protein
VAGILVAIAVSAGLTSCHTTRKTVARSAATAGGSGVAATCDAPFQARVQRGPDTGLALRGRLHISVDASGRLTGQLATDSGMVAITGEAVGRSISMVLAPSPDRILFAVGAGLTDVMTCQPPMGGPLTGPRSSDAGDWSIGNTPSGGTDPSGI